MAAPPTGLMALCLSRWAFGVSACVLPAAIAARVPAQTDPPVAAPGAIQVVTNAGSWGFPGESMIVVRRRLYHGADTATSATVYWPQRADRRAMYYKMDVASDAFGNREPWLLAWRSDSAVLWLVRGAIGVRPGQLPRVESLRRVELHDPGEIRSQHVIGIGPEGFLPAAVADAIAVHMQLPAAAVRRVAEEQVVEATVDETIEVLCRLRLVTEAGEPVAGAMMRFPVVLPLPKADPGAIEAAPAAGARPTNNGIDTVRAVSAAGGWVTALVSLSELASEYGAVVQPSPGTTSHAAGRAAPAVVRPEPLRLSAAEVRMHARHEPSRRLVRGVLVDEHGKAVAGAVIAVAPATTSTGVAIARSGTTAATGRFAVHGVASSGAVQVAVRTNGMTHALPQAVTFAGPQPANSDEVTLLLELVREPGGGGLCLRRRAAPSGRELR